MAELSRPKSSPPSTAPPNDRSWPEAEWRLSGDKKRERTFECESASNFDLALFEAWRWGTFGGRAGLDKLAISTSHE
jgi:hypothetical protein